MKLTKEQAIDYSIELWEWIVETNAESKRDWPQWEKYGDDVDCDCFLCEYGLQEIEDICKSRCLACPYYQKFHGKCYWRNRIYRKWEEAKTEEGRKKYAKLFLEQLRSLK